MINTRRIRTLFVSALLATGVSICAPTGAFAQEMPQGSSVGEAGLAAPKADWNYQWRNDVQAQVMAQHLGPVLHRVEGSWFNAPDIPQESRESENSGTALLGPGTPIFVGNKICTLAVAGFDAAGRKVGITAGHCGGTGEKVYSADAPGVGEVGVVTQSVPELDYAAVVFNNKATVTRSYAGVTVNALGGVTTLGQQLCKKGVATGLTCGIAWDQYQSQVCAMQGDSGGPMLAGDRLVGIVSGGSRLIPNGACRTPWQGPLHTPTVSAPIDAVLAHLDTVGGPGAGFRLP
ncbi:S1 family peptidase [Corynebacterium epidermidicanis]|uniref:Trypsin n=1 Tax=Corynebacterium epidermidicanis TaxID=1050174 RepID=A0A0G3GSN8_9CORY|nr:S1 family peptidase [Corynebacterium epidermidicanis]AKK02578.1 Trypsin [Corynebacterium epidermidicanis]